jgi:hypothetical protein
VAENTPRLLMFFLFRSFCLLWIFNSICKVLFICSNNWNPLVFRVYRICTYNDSRLKINMTFRSTAEEMERLQLSDDDTEDLWNSPSKRGARKTFDSPISDKKVTTEPRASHDGADDPLFDHKEAREAALHTELQGVRNINEVIEGLLSSLDSAKGNMEVFCSSFTLPEQF